jgi:hypothetical protein
LAIVVVADEGGVPMVNDLGGFEFAGGFGDFAFVFGFVAGFVKSFKHEALEKTLVVLGLGLRRRLTRGEF